MTIVKMKRLCLVAPSAMKRKLLRELTRYGCVEIESGEKFLADPAWTEFLEKERGEANAVSSQLSSMNSALTILQKHAPAKGGMMVPKRTISEADFYDEEQISNALTAAQKINQLAQDITELYNRQNQLMAKKCFLSPWQNTDVPLDIKAGKTVSLIFGTCPSSVNLADLQDALSNVKECKLVLENSDKEQHYLSLLVHKSVEEEALDALKPKGFSTVSFKGYSGTARENMDWIDAEIDQNIKTREALVANIVEQQTERQVMEQALDALSLDNTRENVLNSQLYTKKTVYMQGWVPEQATEQIQKVMQGNECAFEFVEAEEGEEPPVLLHNRSGLVSSFGSITELYGLPGYKTVIDPNPFVAIFYFLFFGLMLSDAAYGLILAIFGFLVLKKAKPDGMFKKFMVLATCVGISSFLWGAAFGSWFGNAIPTVVQMATGKEITVPYILDPLAEPMKMLVLSLGFGVVHLFLGMGLSGYRMIKQGHVFDAICDILFWYLIIGGLLAVLLGAQVGLYVALVGAVGVLLTGGRHKKGFGKITGGLGSLYGITSYLSDILSYSRLMALGLATGVVATVINTMGGLAGNGVTGWILFVVVFIIGQAFNLAISLLGAFVHTCRLQYVEFFGKFFEGGGRSFKPLYNKTKYMRILKEEN